MLCLVRPLCSLSRARLLPHSGWTHTALFCALWSFECFQVELCAHCHSVPCSVQSRYCAHYHTVLTLAGLTLTGLQLTAACTPSTQRNNLWTGSILMHYSVVCQHSGELSCRLPLYVESAGFALLWWTGARGLANELGNADCGRRSTQASRRLLCSSNALQHLHSCPRPLE